MVSSAKEEEALLFWPSTCVCSHLISMLQSSRISVFLHLKYFGMFHLSSFLEAPYSCCLVHVVGGQLYMWGRVKMTGDNWMYPKPVIGIR